MQKSYQRVSFHCRPEASLVSVAANSMIIRIRTNVGVNRIEISEDVTVAELRERVLSALRIQAPLNAVVLSLDLEHQNVLSNDERTLSSYNIRHGAEIFVAGKFEKRTVDKSFVNSDGAVVQAGTSLHTVDEEGNDISFDQLNDSQVEQIVPIPAEHTIREGRPQAVVPIPEPASTAQPPAAQEGTDPSSEDFGYVDYGDLRDYNDLDNGVRAPEPAQRMTLLEEDGAEFNLANTPGGRSLMHAVLTDQELAQVGQLERTLREAGLREYDVQLEVQNLQDELIARRLQRESAPYGDTITQALFQAGATHEDLEEQMRQMDRTLERFHAGGSTHSLRRQQAQQHQGGVLRLQEAQGTNRQPQGRAVAPAAPAPAPLPVRVPVAAASGKGAVLDRVLAMESGSSGRSGDGGGSASPSQHSELTSSVASAAPIPRRRTPAAVAGPAAAGPAVPATSAATVKARQPSAAFAAATRSSGPPAVRRETTPKEGGAAESGDGGAESKLSALQRNALRSLSAPTSDQPAAATNRDPEDGSRRRQEQEDELKALVSQLAAYSQGQGRKTGGKEQASGGAAAAGKGVPQSGEKGEPTAAATPKLAVQGRDRTAGAKDPAPAPRSLRDGGYKTMAEIKQQKQAAAGRGSTAGVAPQRKAAVPSFSSKKPSIDPAPETQTRAGQAGSSDKKASAPAPATGELAARVTAERLPAPYSMREVRGVLEGSSRSGGPTAAPVPRSGGVATTAVTKPSGAGKTDYGAAEDLDDTLALTLQLSLEDSNSRPSPKKRAAPVTNNRLRDDYPGYNTNPYPAYDDVIAAADAAILEARRVQELLDAEAAEEMLRYEAEHAAAEREYEEQLARQARRPLLQQRLQYGTGGPVPMQMLDRAMTEDANAGVLDLAAAESFAQHYYGHGHHAGPFAHPAPDHQHQQQQRQEQPRQQQRGWIGGVDVDGTYLPAQGDLGDGNLPEVFFDQEDELLARAIQDSLNDQGGWL